MIIYSNTTPFIALSSIDQLDMLPKIFGKVHVAKAVIDECAEGGRIIVPDITQLSWIIPVADVLAANRARHPADVDAIIVKNKEVHYANTR